MQSKKLIESQFIVKITDIMKEHPDQLKWTDNGTQLHLVNIDQFCQKVLPQYFRHSNFNSFIRQLNIYSFIKTKKIAKSMWFKHDIFKRGNENNFFLVQRKRKFKELENYQERFEKQCEDLIQEVNNKRQITAQVKEVIVNMLEYKFVSHVNLKRMKCELDALYKDLKDSRNKKIHELATEMKSDLLSSIGQLTAESKKIDEFISRNFLRAKESSETKQIPELNQNDVFYTRHMEHVYGMSQTYPKSRSVTKEEPQQYYVTEEARQNFRSYNSFHVFLEQFKTRKDQFTYEHKLYNPFHSQNSFMFLPNYVAAPSHLPYDGRFSMQYQSVVNENHENEEKNEPFDNFDESASISFVDVKDFQQQEEMLVQGN